MAGADQTLKDVAGILPLLALWVVSMVVVLAAPFLRRPEREGVAPALSVLGALLALALLIRRTGAVLSSSLFAGALLSDTLSTAAAFVLLLAGLLALLVSQGYLKARGLDKPEYYGLLLLSLSGAYVMVLANDLLVLLLGLELMSFGFYVMTGFDRRSARSQEAALKYFLTGAFASAVFIYGMMLAYGALGTTSLELIPSAVAKGALASPMGIGAVIFLLAGLAFKVAAVPFHQWTPDVYEGAPTSATSFFAATAKIGAFGAMIRVLDVLAGGSAGWLPVLSTIAIATMILGNLIAIAQTNVKRMLGYSAIAHAGYLLAAMVCVAMRYVSADAAKAGMPAMNAAVFYLLAYALATIGAFGVLAHLSSAGKDVQSLEDLRGLAREEPGTGYALVLFMLSLAGIPATAGFVGKWQVFYALLIAGAVPLAITVALTSVLGAYYYLRVIWYVIFEDSPIRSRERPQPQTGTRAAIAIAALMTVVLGITPGVIMGFLSVVR